jgi:hypothetical protein
LVLSRTATGRHTLRAVVTTAGRQISARALSGVCRG